MVFGSRIFEEGFGFDDVHTAPVDMLKPRSKLRAIEAVADIAELAAIDGFATKSVEEFKVDSDAAFETSPLDAKTGVMPMVSGGSSHRVAKHHKKLDVGKCSLNARCRCGGPEVVVGTLASYTWRFEPLRSRCECRFHWKMRAVPIGTLIVRVAEVADVAFG